MEKKYDETLEIDIRELARSLIHKWWLIILVGFLVSAGTFAYSYFLVEPIYTSLTKVYVINRQDGNRMTLSDLQTGTQLTKDYLVLVKSTPVLQQIINRMGLSMTQEELAELVQINNPQDTRILEIEVSHTDPIIAKQLADAFAEVSSEQMVKVMEMEKVNIIEAGNIPLEPSSPNVLRSTLIGGITGCLLVSVAIMIYMVSNDSIKTVEDIEKYLDMTTLGVIPNEGELSVKKRKLTRVKRNKKSAIAS